jgi:hypothetical protein
MIFGKYHRDSLGGSCDDYLIRAVIVAKGGRQEVQWQHDQRDDKGAGDVRR